MLKIVRNVDMNLLNFVKRSLSFVLAVTIATPGFASDPSFEVQTQENESTGLIRHNFFIGAEQVHDGTSAVYHDQPGNQLLANPIINDFPNMPYFAPYDPNGAAPANIRINEGITSFPLVIRLPGKKFGGNLPYSLKQQLIKDGIVAENMTIGVVAQNIPFTNATQLCFRPHTFIYPEAQAAMAPHTESRQSVEIGIFESERKQAKLSGHDQNTMHTEEVNVHPDQQGQTLLSPNNMHLSGVTQNNPDSFYTYTRYQDNGLKAAICLHILMNDAQHTFLHNLTTNLLSSYLTFGNFKKVLLRKNNEFDGHVGLIRIIGLLNDPVKFVVPSAVAKPIAFKNPGAAQDGVKGKAELIEFNHGLGSWAYRGKSAANGFIYINGADTVEVRPKSYNLSLYREMEVELIWNGISYPSIKQELKPLAPNVNRLPVIYDSKKSLNQYLEELNNHITTKMTSPEHLEFNCDLPPVGLDPFKLIFKREGCIEYYDYKIEQTKQPPVTTAYVLYRFKREYGDIFGTAIESQSGSVFQIPHVRVSRTIVPEIMWVNDFRELMSVTHAKYNTLPNENARKWLNANKSMSHWGPNPESYVTTEYDLDHPSGCILDPHLELADDLIKHQGITPTLLELPTNAYLRLKNIVTKKGNNYIYSDGTGRLFLSILEERFYVNQDHAAQSDGTLGFTDKKTILVATAHRSNQLISLPKDDKTIGNGFTEGFYRLNLATSANKKNSQIWIPSKSGQSITIECNELKENGAYSPIPGFTNLCPKNDGTVELPEFKDSQYAALIDYLTTYYWLERKAPVIKFRFQGKDEDQIKEASFNLNKLIIELPGASLDLDACYYLQQAPNSDMGVLQNKEKFAQRDHTSGAIWSIAGSIKALCAVIGAMPSVREIKLDAAPIWELEQAIIAIDQIDRISHEGTGTRSFKATGPDTDSGELDSLRYVFKVKRLSMLYLTAFKSCVSNMFYSGLGANAATLTHLDLSGAKNLKDKGDLFVNTVSQLKHLQFLGLLKTDLYNGHTVDLVRALIDKEHLSELKISMPYWPSLAFEMNKRLVIDRWMETKDLKDIIFNTISTGAGIGLSPFRLCDDLLGDQGMDYADVCKNLGKIKPLQKLTLKLGGLIGWYRWTTKQITQYRKDAGNNKPLEITYEN
jgi:hypothetical protein